MFAANTCDIRLATEADEASLRRLADLASGRGLQHPVLIGRVDGETAAAMSIVDGRIAADPQRRTDHLLACLRVRADALRAYEATPSLRARMLAAVSAGSDACAAGADERTPRRRSTTARTSTNGRMDQRLARPRVSTRG